MKVHLFGLPLNVHRRLKEESSNWTDAVAAPHSFRATPISTKVLEPFTESELNELVAAVGEGFTHVVIPGSRDWQEIKRRLQYDCRIHIARLREPIRDLTWPILQEQLRAITQMDEIWLDRLAPTDLRNPLLLPPPIFETYRETHDYWRHCDVYLQEQFDSAESMLEEVRRHHLHPDQQGGRSWLDSRSRRFRADASRHALSTTDRAGKKSYRFCLEIPKGFHYDVTHDLGKAFRMTIDGRVQMIAHCNVTPWGKIRSG